MVGQQLLATDAEEFRRDWRKADRQRVGLRIEIANRSEVLAIVRNLNFAVTRLVRRQARRYEFESACAERLCELELNELGHGWLRLGKSD